MIKYFTTALIIFSSIHLSYGQHHLGVKAGVHHTGLLNNSDANLTDVFQFEFKSSVGFGLFYEYQSKGKWSIATELCYNNKGAGYDTYSDKVNLNYISWYILPHFKISKNFEVFIGSEIGILMWSRIRTADGNKEASYLFNNDVDLGAVGGIKVNLTNRWAIDFRYVHGLINTLDEIYSTNDGSSKANEYRYSNANFQLNLRGRILSSKSY